MRIALPEEAVQVPLDRPAEAVRTFAAVMARLRDAPDGSTGDLEAAATEAVETAVRGGAFLMAVLAPPGCGAALLTGVLLEVPQGWDAESVEQLRDSMENIGGPDVRETATMATGVGTAVIACRAPGAEQARERKPMTLQVQALIPDPDEPTMLLLTLAAPTTLGWARHQELFAGIVASACPADGPVTRPEPVPEDSFENVTYRL